MPALWTAAGRGALVAALLMASVPSGRAQQPWPGYNNTYDGQRFSPLKEIDPDSVSRLVEACSAPVGAPGPFESGLVMVGATLYLTLTQDTVALDARTCALRWRSTYAPAEPVVALVNRGVAVLDGRLFRGTGDGRLLAMDARDGTLLWSDVIGNPRISEFMSSAPIAWNGLVFAGIAGGDWGAKGRMMAYDAVTGREVWRFDTIPTGRETGAETWPSALAAKTGGGALWTSYTLDVSTGEIFIPVGNPAPDFAPSYRPGANLFTDSVVVLDARTGALKWWYQLTPHDGQDHDLSAPPVLYRDGRLRDIVAFAGKDGYLQGVDRDSHKLLFRTAISPILNEGATPTAQGVRICPGFLGGAEWNGPAFDVLDQSLVVGSVDWCGTVSTAPPVFHGGQLFFGGSMKMDAGRPTGWVTAVDAETGKIRWRVHADAPVIAGVTPTAGGVTFTGDTAGNFLVLDSRTGEVLRKLPTGGAMAGGVATYAIEGKQYVAFTAGNVSRVTFGELGQPSIHVMTLAAAPAAVAGGPDPVQGKALFGQICAACHGADGTAIAQHSLKDLKSRKDFDATVQAIEDPKPPMPKLFPASLSAADVKNLAAYLQGGI